VSRAFGCCVWAISLVAAPPAGAQTETQTSPSSSITREVSPLSDQRDIRVETPERTIPMDVQEYQKYAKGLGYLPVLSRSYVFGHTIPTPKTDKRGHIHVSEPAPPDEAEAPLAAAPASVSEPARATRPAKAQGKAKPHRPRDASALNARSAAPPAAPPTPAPPPAPAAPQ
jgi:hypothetical protein